jgi:hypothetical protein
VNYDDMKKDIEGKIRFLYSKNELENIWFYSSDYSDILGMDNLS